MDCIDCIYALQIRIVGGDLILLSNCTQNVSPGDSMKTLGLLVDDAVKPLGLVAWGGLEDTQPAIRSCCRKSWELTISTFAVNGRKSASGLSAVLSTTVSKCVKLHKRGRTPTRFKSKCQNHCSGFLGRSKWDLKSNWNSVYRLSNPKFPGDMMT